MRYTIGLDIGTFESKGVLVDGAGTIVASAAAPHRMIVPRPGWAEHRAEEDWWGDFVTITRRLLAESGIDAKAIACVAASAIGPCVLPVDADGRPLMNAVLYGVDTRASGEIADLTRRIGADTILARCGNALTAQSAGPKILWLKRNRPEICAQAAYFLTSTSYLVFRLTGEIVIDHFTAAGFSPLYDVDACDWTMALADNLASRERLPRLLWSTEIAGHVSARAAAETGLAEGTPVTAGTIDAAAEAVSVGVRHAGDMMIMYGSTVFVIQLTPQRARDARLWYAPWLTPGSHAAMAGLATSGTLTHWFRDTLARDLPAETAFAALAEEAEASPPGANGLLMLPHFSGERSPLHDPLAKGAWFGLTLAHSRGDMYRALLEGIASGTAHALESFRDAGQPPGRVTAVGGGTRNRVWLQATADIAGVAQAVPGITVGAAYGDAFLAACAVGMVVPEDIAAWNPPVRTVQPVARPVYARQYRLFRELYETTKGIAAALERHPT